MLLLLGIAGSARADDRWNEYQLLMWQDRTPVQMEGLKALGFSGAKLHATGGGVDASGRTARRLAGLPYYLENIATDFYASYHRYTQGKAVTWRFDAAKARRLADPADPDVFVREPGLSDTVWLDRIRARLTAVVRAEAPGQPLFYNMGDESGIADLAVAWDFDTSPASLAGMRTWLQTQYPNLAALNLQWRTAYAAWDAVMPELTDAAIRRTDGNFSAWSDFKAWMDVAFARAVRAGTDAVHAGDPQALAALEGGQLPGWGGYDYTLVAPALDLMEIYDFGNSTDLAAAFNPALITLRTSFGRGPREAHAAWQNLLHGGRGMIVWDEADDVVRPDGTAGPRGTELSALVAGIRVVAPALRQAKPAPDPVAVLYSQASFRVRWMLDRQAGDHDWAARDAEREYDDNAWRASRQSMVQRLAELAVQPRFVSGAMLGGLRDDGVKVLLLPHAIALSDAEVASIQAFRQAGGTVLADTEPGQFDGHGRRRTTPVLADVPHPAAIRTIGGELGPQAELAALLEKAGASPRAMLVGPDGQRASGVEVRWFSAPGGTILALQAGRPWGAPGRIGLHLSGLATIADLRHPRPPVVTDRLDIVLDPIEPTVLRITPP